MIKIERNEINYSERIKNEKVNDKIVFLEIGENKYTIDRQKLLEETRDEVFKVSGIKLYIEICRMFRLLKKKTKMTNVKSRTNPIVRSRKKMKLIFKVKIN